MRLTSPGFGVQFKDGRESFKMYKTNDTLSLELLPAENTR